MTAASDLIVRTETALRDAARVYLDFWWSCEGQWSSSAQATYEEQEARQRLCAAFEHLIERRLTDRPDWPPDAWFDGFFPDQIQVISQDALAIPGAFLWVEGQRWWLEPGFGSVALNTGRYVLKVGDASQGLRKTPYTNPRRVRVWIEPTSWVFTVRG